jgi:polysaccharide export outer membrane protein
MEGILLRYLAALCVLAISAGSAVADNYRLKPGDKLEVTVWQEPKLNRIVVVAPDGRISFPLAGRIKAGGTTVDVVENMLKARLAKQYTDDIDVSVAIADIKEPPPKPPEKEKEKILPGIFVTGEVAKPGRYEYRHSVNVLQAIALAGGLAPFAAEKRIKIRRKQNGSETLYEFDYDAFSSGEDLSGNMTLQNGDVVIVPERHLFE